MKNKQLFTFCLIGAPVLSVASFSQKTVQKPNIILILADDMGYSDIGCFGSEICTPNLDRLARQGVRFTQFYNASRSCPTRASLLTGLYQHQAGVGDMVNDLGYPSYQGYLNNQCVTIAEVLKSNGYNTYMSGKWHVGSNPENHPLKRGFDHYFGLIDGASSYFGKVAYKVGQPAPRLMLEDKDMWDLRMAVYAAMIDRLDQNIGKVLDKLKKIEKLDNTLVIFLADNGGCHEVTRNQKKITGLYGTTGNPDSFDSYEIPWANVSNTPFRMFKHWVHEGGIATPFIAYFPGTIGEGKIVTQTGHIIDIMPTFMEIAGGKYPENYNGNKIQPMEGISLMPALKGKTLNRTNPLFWEHEGNRAIRDGDWKLVSAYDNVAKKFKSWELYNLKNDRSELNDLSLKDPEKALKMAGEFDKWASRAGVVLRSL